MPTSCASIMSLILPVREEKSVESFFPIKASPPSNSTAGPLINIESGSGVMSGSTAEFNSTQALLEFWSNFSLPLGRECLEHFARSEREFYRRCITLRFHFNAYIFSFVVNSLLVGFLCITGVLGNIVSFVVISHDHTNVGNTNFLLKALALADSLFLVECFFYSSLRFVYPITGLLSDYYHTFPVLVPYLWTAGMTTQTLVNWLVVLISLERYIVVQKPFLASVWCRSARVKAAALLCAVGSLVYNLPRLYEWKIVEKVMWPCSHYTRKQAVDSYLRQNQFYSIFYRAVLYALLVAIGPVLFLLVLNVRLSRALRAAYLERYEMVPTAPPGTPTGIGIARSTSAVLRNRSITRLIVVIVTVFIICEVPALAHQILASFNLRFPLAISLYSVSLSNALVVVKSSSNFIIYCLCGRKFRYIFRRLIRSGRRGGQNRRVPRSLYVLIRRFNHQGRPQVVRQYPAVDFLNRNYQDAGGDSPARMPDVRRHGHWRPNGYHLVYQGHRCVDQRRHCVDFGHQVS